MTRRITIENDYAALLFSIDALRHPILRGIDIPNKSEAGDFVISKTEMTTLRVDILNGTSLDAFARVLTSFVNSLHSDL